MGMRPNTEKTEALSAEELGSTLSPSSRQAERDELNRQIEEFFSRGKSIEKDDTSCGPWHYLEDVPEDKVKEMAKSGLPQKDKERPNLNDPGSKFYKPGGRRHG